MTPSNVRFTSIAGPAGGGWRVGPGQALTLRPARGGRLRVTDGGLWATFDGPHAGPANERGDHLLGAGDLVVLHPGERLVVEPVSRVEGARIEWEPDASPVPAAGLPWGVRLLRHAARAAVPGSRAPRAAARLLLALAAGAPSRPPA